ncbi:VOC family protein [Glycomyces halotolerans]
MPTPVPIGAPTWADSLSADIATDAAFYRRLFGWTAADSGEDGYHYHTFFKDGRAVMGVAPAPPGEAASRTWNLHFRIGNCAEATAEAARLGGKVAMEPTDFSDQLRFSMILDPNGAAFGLVEPVDAAAAFEAFGEVGAVSWAEYGVDGVPSEAMRFYADLLGWEVTVPPWESPDNPRPYAAVRTAEGEGEFGGCHALDEGDDEPAQWYAMVRVEDVEALCAKATELGGSVPGPPVEVPGAKIAGIATPTDTIVSVTEYVDFAE